LLVNTIDILKGQCHEIVDFRFFSWISFPQAPEYPVRAVSNFFENSRRYHSQKIRRRWTFLLKCCKKISARMKVGSSILACLYCKLWHGWKFRFIYEEVTNTKFFFLCKTKSIHSLMENIVNFLKHIFNFFHRPAGWIFLKKKEWKTKPL
jgi:hypothetical protein